MDSPYRLPGRSHPLCNKEGRQQARLRALQGLHGGFSSTDSLARRRAPFCEHSDHVPQLSLEPRVVRPLEGAHAMRLDAGRQPRQQTRPLLQDRSVLGPKVNPRGQAQDEQLPYPTRRPPGSPTPRLDPP